MTILASAMLPRLSVAAFIVSAHVGNPIREAAGDHRMQHVQVNVHVGGVEAAIKALNTTHQRLNAIYIEVPGESEQILSEVARLAQSVATDAVLTIVGHVNDVKLYRRLIDLGVLIYMEAPFTADDFIASLASFVDTGFEAEGGATIAVYGTRGGAGGTTIAANLVTQLSASSASCIADFTMPFGAVAWAMGIEPPDNANILFTPAKIDSTSLDSLLVEKAPRLNVLVPNRGVKFREAHDDYSGLIKLLRVRHEFVVLDLPKIWVEWTAVALCAATQVVLVVTPDFAGVSNAQDVLKHVRHNRTATSAPPIVVVNQVGAPHRSEIRTDEIATMLNINKRDLVCVRYDAKAFSVAEQHGSTVSSPPAAKALQGVVERIAGAPAASGIGARQPKNGKSVGSLLQTLFRRTKEA